MESVSIAMGNKKIDSDWKKYVMALCWIASERFSNPHMYIAMILLIDVLSSWKTTFVPLFLVIYMLTQQQPIAFFLD